MINLRARVKYLLSRWNVFLLAAISLTLVTTTVIPPTLHADSQTWQATEWADHKLVGTWWDARKGKSVSRKQVVDAITTADIVLLGEIHDNPDHHTMQASLVAALAGRGRKPGIVWEMIRTDKQPILTKVNFETRNTNADTAAARAQVLGSKLAWEKSGWPAWKFYAPIAEAAFRARLPLFAGDALRSSIRKLGRQGLDALPPSERKALAMDRVLPDDLSRDLRSELKRSHCNMMPDSGLAMMANVQRFRDGNMARNLRLARNESPDGSAVLIAGSGHTRKDRGVPYVLKQVAPSLSTVTVNAVEVSPDAKSAKDLVAKAPDGAPLADYVYITPAQTRPDPCEQLRKQMEAIRKQRSQSSTPK